jgi:hypothetical protein
MKVNVKVIGTVRPSGAITPMQLAKAVSPYVGKSFSVEIDSSKTVQDLANAVDVLLGISPSSTFEEVLMERSIILDKTMSLQDAGVADGDDVSYRFVLAMN